MSGYEEHIEIPDGVGDTLSEHFPFRFREDMGYEGPPAWHMGPGRTRLRQLSGGKLSKDCLAALWFLSQLGDMTAEQVGQCLCHPLVPDGMRPPCMRGPEGLRGGEGCRETLKALERFGLVVSGRLYRETGNGVRKHLMKVYSADRKAGEWILGHEAGIALSGIFAGTPYRRGPIGTYRGEIGHLASVTFLINQMLHGEGVTGCLQTYAASGILFDCAVDRQGTRFAVTAVRELSEGMRMISYAVGTLDAEAGKYTVLAVVTTRADAELVARRLLETGPALLLRVMFVTDSEAHSGSDARFLRYSVSEGGKLQCETI